MELKDLQKKLEFDVVLNSIKKFIYSDSGREKLEEIEYLTDKYEIEQSLAEVFEMKEYVAIEGEFDLSKLRDIRTLIEQTKISGFYLTGERFLWILDFLILSRLTKSNFSAHKKETKEKYGRIFTLLNDLFSDKILEHNIEITIDKNGDVKDGASVQLKKIRNEIKSRSETLRKKLYKILKDFSEDNVLRDDIITLRDGRSVIPVKVENKRKIPGIIHSSSASGATIFIEPEDSIELNNELTELQFEEKREVEKILTALTEQLAKYYEELKINSEIFAKIDFLQAKAKYALKINGQIPQFDKGEIEVFNAYNPVLLENLNRSGVVPLNLNIGKDFNTLIISGPNAGGKTVVLKTIGLLQMMLQSGILIPCDDNSTMRFFDKIFVNIGDEQSIEHNLSTFSSHLKIIKEIIDKADENSLVLIDEICAGTDPTLGSALSCSILKSLSVKGCITLVSTHMGDLKTFAYSTPNIENASLEFNYDTFSPNFNLITGVPGQSFTFEIAKKFELPEKLITYSESLLGNRENDIEKIIKELNQNKQKFEQLKNDFYIKNIKLKGLINLYENRLSEIKSKEKSYIKEAKNEAENIISNANRLIEKTIREIREKPEIKPADVKNKFKDESIKILKSAMLEGEKEEEKDYAFRVKDSVKLKGGSSVGEILEIKEDYAIVDFNGMSVKSKLIELEKSGSAKKADSKSHESRNIFISNPEWTLDLRGKFTEDIKDMIDVFIYNANINSLKQVKIIHGKGSGKLRQKVTEILKETPSVKSFKLGDWNEGGTGVTVIDLND